jgi:hypothetical protein
MGEMNSDFWSENLMERDNLQNLDVNGRIGILNVSHGWTIRTGNGFS